jgi:hypothetical protein
MKRMLFIMLMMLTVVSCKREDKSLAKEKAKPVSDQYPELYGNWVGDFIAVDYDTLTFEGSSYLHKINLVIKKIEHDTVFGLSIVAGNNRPLIGSIQKKGGKYHIDLNEPGDKKNDGHFEFSIDNDTLQGKWIVNDKKKSIVWERKYKLVKQAFKYNPKLMLPLVVMDSDNEGYVDYDSMKTDSVSYQDDDGKKVYYQRELYRFASNVVTELNASTTVLKESDVKNLKKLELEIIRNTIFARHGYSFKKKSFRQFFDPVAWYIPVTDDMSGKLTAVEQKNIVLLNRFQKYAEDNYDSFGR